MAAWCAALATTNAAAGSGGLALRALEATTRADATTLTMRLSSAAQIKVSTVEVAPGEIARLYIDLPRGTRIDGQLLDSLPCEVGALASVRVGANEQGAPRVVVDVGGAAQVRTRRLDGGRPLTIAFAPPARRVQVESRPRVPPAPRQAIVPLPRLKIVIDPGHGGQDPGAEGFAIEKDVTLAIAQELAGLLTERLRAESVLTRSDDRTLTLAERTARANAEGADLFLSIHANASERPTLRGIETYYLNNTDDRATTRLAALENGLDLLHPAAGRSDLRYILSDLVQVGKMDESIALARAVQRGLVQRLRRGYPSVTDLGVKRGPFYVLVGAYMPCVLVETSFLTHAIEGSRLATPDYQRAVAEGIYAGVARYVADTARARTL